MDTENSSCPFTLPSLLVASNSLSPVIEKSELALIMLLGFAGFSALIGMGYNTLRYYIFKDRHQFDVVFDAGGRVSLSLTTVTAMSQLMWPADFLQSPTIASKVGIGGSLWYTMAIVIAILLFAVLCMKLKSRAPGAKTFPQIAYVRFGKDAHVLFCTVAIFTNLIIVANLILAGKAAMNVLAKDTNDEFVCLLLAVLFGSYCLIGGLGTTFYISYFNTCITFIAASYFIIKTRYGTDDYVRNMTSINTIYEAVSCLKGPSGNNGNSFLTFRSESGIIAGIVMLFMTTAICFCDQANWQSKIAAKPSEGVVGFLLASFLWFAIPTSISFMSALTYQSMSYKHGANLLSAEQIDKGFITPFVVQTLFGKTGVYMLLTLITMTLMSTGSGEVMSISSILVYDIYKTHIKPFRSGLRPTDCVLCGHSKLSHISASRCRCLPAKNCKDCAEDIEKKRLHKDKPGFSFKCKIHGQYRHYEQELMQYKTWCMTFLVAAIVPYGLVIIESGMNLNWAFMAAQVFIAPFLSPLFFLISWTRVTSPGLIAGCMVGVVCGVSAMLLCASSYEGGLSDFYTNTAKDYSILSGLLAGFLASTIICVSISLLRPPKRSTRCKRMPLLKQETPDADTKNNESDQNKDNVVSIIDEDDDDFEEGDDIEWRKTMSIDNPLHSYCDMYQDELDELGVKNGTVTTVHMETIFKGSKRISAICAGVSFIIFILLIPSFALSQTVLTEQHLNTWISVCQHWCLIATVLVVIIPPVQEGIQIWRQYKANVAAKQTGEIVNITDT